MDIKEFVLQEVKSRGDGNSSGTNQYNSSDHWIHFKFESYKKGKLASSTITQLPGVKYFIPMVASNVKSFVSTFL